MKKCHWRKFDHKHNRLVKKKMMKKKYQNISCMKTIYLQKDFNIEIKCIIILSKNTFAVSASNHHIYILNILSKTIQKVLKGHKDVISCIVKINDMKIVSSSWDKSIKIWDCKKGCVIWTMYGHRDWVLNIIPLNDVYMNNKKDPNLIVSTSWDNSIRVWNLRNKKEVYDLTNWGFETRIFCIVQVEKFIVAFGTSNNVVLYHILKKLILKQISIKKVTGNCDSIMKLSSKNICFSTLNWINIWDIEENKVNWNVFHGHFQYVNKIMLMDRESNCDQVLISCSRDKTIRIWDIEKKQLLYVLEGHLVNVKSINAFQDNTIVSGGAGIKVWSTKNLFKVDPIFTELKKNLSDNMFVDILVITFL